MKKKNNILVISDTHLPAVHPGYLDFAREQARRFKCAEIIHCGDLLDHHACSFHTPDSDLYSPGDELKIARAALKPWYKAFPKMKICLGNHDNVPARKLKEMRVAKEFIRAIGDVLDAPKGWQFEYSFEIQDILFKHIPQGSTLTAQLRAAERNTMPTVTGHAHSVSGVAFSAGFKTKMWAMAVGCGVDRHHLAMAYGKESAFKPVLSCGVILEGNPIVIPMDL